MIKGNYMLVRICLALLSMASGLHLYAGPTLGPGVPKFDGIDLSISTNHPGDGFPVLQIVTAFRIDLTNPNIRLLTTPRRDDYEEDVRETGAFTVSSFLKNNGLQASINANFFSPGGYYYPTNYPMD